MSRFYNYKLVAFACVFALACVVCVRPQFADCDSGTETEDTLNARVAALEDAMAQLRQQIQNDKVASSLSGHWVEQSRVVAGRREKQQDEVAWRLATDVSSDRYILAPEVSSYRYGPFSLDTSKEPACIDFTVRRFGQSNTVKGIVRTSFGECEIAIPGKLFDGNTFLNPPRPTSFESTADNGYDVYKLVRELYQKTGVWQ